MKQPGSRLPTDLRTAVSLESILCTEELSVRPVRSPNYEEDNGALEKLLKALVDAPAAIFQSLANTILEVLRADSAGLSLLTTHDDGRRFYWPAIAGAWKPHVGGGAPRDCGPCGDVLDGNAPLLFRRPERRYSHLLPLTPPAEEILVIPFYLEGKAVGTIWAIAHSEQRRFDLEDLRQLESLGRFASAAYRSVHLKQGDDARRAALNLMQDAVQARQTADNLNLELRASEARFRALFELGPVAVYSCDASGVIREFNRRAAELWGRAPALGDTDQRFCGSFKMIRPDGTVLAHEECPMAEVLSGTIPLARDAEVNIERPDGSTVTVVVNISPLINAHGDISGAINCFYDITERKAIEAALRASEDRHRTLADNMAQFAWTADPQGGINWFNQRWYDYTGATLEDMQARGWKEIVHPDHVSRVLESLTDSWETGDPWEDTFPLRGKDGEYRWFLSRALPIRDGEDKVVRWFGTHTDVTKQREMEDQIKGQAEDLAGESRRKDEFLAMLSHELRNPLAPIKSAVRLLKTYERNGENTIQRQAREIIERQTANLSKIIDDLLEVSRVVSGRIRLSQQTVDLNQVVRHAIETVTPLLHDHRHELVQSLSSKPVWVNVDSTRMEEVLINLLTNAAKYTPEGGRIEVYCEQPQAPQTAQVRVRDNGIGIEPELLKDGRIFELFTQADRSLARSSGGLGIGLSLAHRLAALHGGSIAVNSPPQFAKTGSEFILTLPLALAPESDETLVPRSDIAAKEVEGARVLVVDDNVDNAMMLVVSLRLKGYSVQSVHNGPDGLRVAQEWRPDVLLLDIGLPGMDGYEIARRLRADTEPEVQNAMMIALTGYGRDADIDRARDAGFDAHLTKPFELGALEKLMATPRIATATAPNQMTKANVSRT